jgi:branched-chain amino acid transport system ATP-binding protein
VEVVELSEIKGEILSIKSLSGGYGGVDILHNVSLTVETGEIVVMIGPNGAGKSTAMKSIFGLIKISGGQVLFNNIDLTGKAPEKIVATGISYVPQTQNIFVTLSVKENLEMGAFILKSDISDRLTRVYDMFPALKEKQKQSAGTLSGGQRQMVAIGKAMMLDPELLLLDEPTAGLSPSLQNDVLETVTEINKSGVSVLMVEQNARQALNVADRGYIFVDGKIRSEGPADQLLSQPDIATLFLGGAPGSS